ncbi:PEP-CTERM sorting domain-containing protein [Candidatus Thiodiazotropha sp. CDECU1]|uniref:PEP-CTERM sorting domain-containing protein n=1 Tax=Candidatus Thiodiazotropha sp. CDECU1 TaxID=3065865 RepID=UPI00292DE596|nr:PEP-CTERM sorting domain-containing protein [Candidatus Thiodiazotropha sp. CDECU1]
MKSFKTTYLNLSLFLAFGVTGLGFTASVAADAIYLSSTSFSLTLENVETLDGYSVDNDYWYASGGEFFIDDTLFTSGDGVADYTSTLATNSSVEMLEGDTITVATGANGEAGLGIAESSIFTALDLFVDNFYYDYLVFNFAYEYTLSAAVGTSTGIPDDDAIAEASLFVTDDFLAVDIAEVAFADLLFGPLSDDYSGSGSFSFMLDSYDYNYLLVESFSGGLAVGASSVPEPSSLMLLSIGLIGIGAIRLRKQA